MAKLERTTDPAYYGGGDKMSDEPVNVINEYLALVREKLPESIADDVVSELEMYMLETARDQGEDGQITFESAKKVVAQFGAPGEVADEYRFSMLPESIPEEDIPKEIVQTSIGTQQKVSREEPLVKKIGVDPTVTHSAFFFKSILLTIFWALIATIASTLIGPIWSNSVSAFSIIVQVFIVVGAFLIRYLDLRSKNTILWKRSYPDWSALQIFVTLPENGLPSLGKKKLFVDTIVSLIGIISCTVVIIFFVHPIFLIFTGIPAIVLLIARIRVSVKRYDDESNQCEFSKYDFGINISLLTILNSGLFWIFSFPYYYNYQNLFTGPSLLLMVMFIVFGGSVLLFEVLIEAQNLWWKTDKSEESEQQKARKITVRKDMFRNGGVLLAKLVGWIIISDAIIVYSSLVFAPDEMSNLYWSRFGGFIGSILLGTALVLGYCLIRYIRVRNFNSTTFIGRRTRLEALVDSIVSLLLIGAVSILALGTMSTHIPGYSIIHFYPNIFHFSISFGGVELGMEFLLLLLVIIAFALRVHGNILEFNSERKIDAAKRQQKSGKLMLVILSFIAGGEFVNYLSLVGTWYFMMSQFYFLFMIVVIFISFQIVSSELKVKELMDNKKSLIEEKAKQVTGNSNHSTSIAN